MGRSSRHYSSFAWSVIDRRLLRDNNLVTMAISAADVLAIENMAQIGLPKKDFDRLTEDFHYEDVTGGLDFEPVIPASTRNEERGSIWTIPEFFINEFVPAVPEVDLCGVIDIETTKALCDNCQEEIPNVSMNSTYCVMRSKLHWDAGFTDFGGRVAYFRCAAADLRLHIEQNQVYSRSGVTPSKNLEEFVWATGNFILNTTVFKALSHIWNVRYSSSVGEARVVNGGETS